MSTSVTYGTRWGRLLVPLALGLAVIATFATLMWRQVLAVQITVQGTAMQFNSTQIVGQDIGFGMVPITTASGTKSVLRAGLAVASLDGLCVSKTETFAWGSLTLKLTAGNGSSGTDITANNAIFDITDLGVPAAGSPVTHISLGGTDQIGLTTTDVTTTRADPSAPVSSSNPYDSDPLWPERNADGSAADPSNSGQGWTGIDATTGTLTSVYGTLWDAQVKGNVVLPKLNISVSPGSGQSCVAAAQAGNFTN